MKIALIGTSLFQHGAEYVMASLARGLAGNGHQVDVILSRYHEKWAREHPDWVPFELPRTVKVVVLPRYKARYMIFCLRRLMSREKYDVVMSHASPYVLPLALGALWLKQRPLTIEVVHSCSVGVDSQGNRIEIVKPTFKWCVQKWLLSKMDAIFTVSVGTAEGFHRMTGYPRSRIFPVFNPVIDDIFWRKIAEKPDHPWLQNGSIPVVVAGGVFYPYKNHLMLFDALAEVLKSRKVRLIVFGEGPMRHQYEERIQELGIGDFVMLPGYTNNFPAAIKCASCYVVSSIIESFSVVCVEALACGVPVVSTNCPYGPPEILKGGEYGILVENKNPHALAEGIIRVLDGKGIKPTLEMVAPYTVEATVARYENAMKELLKHKKGKPQ